MKPGFAEKVWLTLIGLTLVGAWLAETGEAGTPLTLTVAALVAIKGRTVIDGYMEMRQASPRIRRVVYAFNAAIPLMIIASHYFGDALARLTSLG